MELPTNFKRKERSGNRKKTGSQKSSGLFKKIRNIFILSLAVGSVVVNINQIVSAIDALHNRFFVEMEAAHADKVNALMDKFHDSVGALQDLRTCFDNKGNLACSKEQYRIQKMVLGDKINELIKEGKGMYDTFALKAHDELLCYAQNVNAVLASSDVYNDFFNNPRFVIIDIKNSINEALKAPYDPKNPERKAHPHDQWDRLLMTQRCYYTKDEGAASTGRTQSSNSNKQREKSHLR